MLLLLACAEPPPAVAQWVWTDLDASLLSDARRTRPVAGGVHVATVHFREGRFENTLALPPTKGGADAAVVIRLDDDVHAAWEQMDDGEVTTALTEALQRVLRLCRSRQAVGEVQLDYDVPVRLLPRWAAVLTRLRPTVGGSLWITSLVAHLESPTYGDQFRAAVDGHILQVFDTGTPIGDRTEVAALAARAAMPYRLGVGAFERAGTEHRAWFAHLGEACVRPWCDTVWVFPGNQPWTQLVEQG